MNSRKAFSLIEISVVILIIGLLIAGISKGADLYQDFKIATARNLTLNSRVGRIANLELWLEATLENSLASGATSYINLTKKFDGVNDHLFYNGNFFINPDYSVFVVE